jgi:hypothetical protein
MTEDTEQIINESRAEDSQSKKRDYSTAWWKARNERRNLRYAMDADHRMKVNRLNQMCYTKTVKHSRLRRVFATPSQLDSIGKEREIFSADGVVIDKIHTMTQQEVSRAIGGYHTIVVARWIRQGKFPRPNLYAMNGLRKIRVYATTAVKGIIEIFKRAKFRGAGLQFKDIETVSKLFRVTGQEPNEKYRELLQQLKPQNFDHIRD